jgi:hypothetical protein
MHQLQFVRFEGTNLIYYYVKNKEIVVLEHDLIHDAHYQKEKEKEAKEESSIQQPAYLIYTNLFNQMVSFGYSPIAIAQAIQDNFNFGRLHGDLENMVGTVMDYMVQMEPVEDVVFTRELKRKLSHDNMAMNMALKKVQFELIVNVGNDDDEDSETIASPSMSYSVEQQTLPFQKRVRLLNNELASIYRPHQKANWKLLVRKGHLLDDTLNQFTNCTVENMKSSFTVYVVNGSTHESGNNVTRYYFTELSKALLKYFTSEKTVDPNIYHLRTVSCLTYTNKIVC